MKYNICRKFGHKWVYSVMSTPYGEVNLRACRRCGCIDEYRKDVPAYGSAWFMLVMRTKKGSENLLTKLEKNK